jgi:hypothetical protein
MGFPTPYPSHPAHLKIGTVTLKGALRALQVLDPPLEGGFKLAYILFPT